jgi:hypothetical protein
MSHGKLPQEQEVPKSILCDEHQERPATVANSSLGMLCQVVLLKQKPLRLSTTVTVAGPLYNPGSGFKSQEATKTQHAALQRCSAAWHAMIALARQVTSIQHKLCAAQSSIMMMDQPGVRLSSCTTHLRQRD